MRHSNDTFSIHGVGMSSAVNLRCLGNLQHNLGIQTIGPDTGNTYNEVRFIGEKRPEILATVMALKSLLADAAVDIRTGLCITADETHPGVAGYMQSHAPCAANARTSGSAHMRVLAPKAHLVVTQLGGQRGQSMSASVRALCLSAATDGSDDPTSVAFNLALPGTFVHDEEFCIAPPRIADIDIDPDSVISWQLETGIDIVAIVPAGSIHPTVVDIRKSVPRFRVIHDDPTLLDDASIPQEGIECDHDDTIFPMQKRNPFGGLVDAGETEHLRFTASGFAYFSTHYDASNSATGTGEIVVECTHPTSVPLVFASGIALPSSYT